MPSVEVNGPKIDNIEIKRELVKDITDALEKAYKIPREHYTVLIRENDPENVGSGGMLIVDKYKLK